MAADGLVEGLPVAALVFDAVHQDVFRGHKGQLRVKMLFDDGGIDLHAAYNIDVKIQYAVHSQEGLRHADSLVGRIVQSSFQPLRSRSYSRIQGICNHIASQ